MNELHKRHLLNTFRHIDGEHGYFGVDWEDPLLYDLTVNSGRLGAAAVELVAAAGELKWARR